MLKNGISLSFVQKLAVLYLVIWTISPPLQIDMIYRLMAMACAGIWFFAWIFRQNPIEIGKTQICALFFLIMVILVVYIQSGKLSHIIKQISFFLLVICFLMNYFYRDNWSELSAIIPIVLILLIVWNSKTVSVLLEDSTIARKLVRDDESIYGYLRQGVGGYSLVYPQVCVFPAVLAWIIKSFKKSNLYFIIGLIWLVTYILLILNASYSLAIFSSVSSIVLILFYRGKSAVKAFLIAALIFSGTMLAILYLDGFRNYLLEFFDGTAVAKKINDLVATSEGGAAEGSIQDRISAYMSSIDVIFRYPVIGSLWRVNGGGHSAVLDTFAKYGLFGGVIYSTMIYSVPNFYKSRYDDVFVRTAANATLVSLLIISIFDTFSYSFMCMILIVLPLVFEDIIKWSCVRE